MRLHPSLRLNTLSSENADPELAAGATHPSFSDVFLILPEYINKLTGLRIAAPRVLALAVGAAADFLDGRADAIRKRAVRYKGGTCGEMIVVDGVCVGEEQEEKDGDGEKVVPRPRKPVGTPGELMWHEF